MPNIEIEYNGRWPNLCSGKLTAIVDGTRYDFPNYVMRSGGSAGFRNNYSEEIITHGPWRIDNDGWPEDFPEQYKTATLEAINEQVPHGCCGGCL